MVDAHTRHAARTHKHQIKQTVLQTLFIIHLATKDSIPSSQLSITVYEWIRSLFQLASHDWGDCVLCRAWMINGLGEQQDLIAQCITLSTNLCFRGCVSVVNVIIQHYLNSDRYTNTLSLTCALHIYTVHTPLSLSLSLSLYLWVRLKSPHNHTKCDQLAETAGS
jgi:hypothetical protein